MRLMTSVYHLVLAGCYTAAWLAIKPLSLTWQAVHAVGVGIADLVAGRYA